MGWRILVFTALFCKVQAQLCVNPGIAPQVIATPPIISAPQIVIDNSVSTALANALQLLIVSDILESKIGASCLSNFLNVNPIIDAGPCYQNVDFITPSVSRVEIISPCIPVVETVVSDGFGSYGQINPYVAELVNPCLSDNIVTPINYYGISDILTPNFYNNPCNAEVIAYNPGSFGGCNELLTPMPYNSYCGEIVTPCNSNGLEVTSPCGFYPGAEIVTQVTPCNSGSFGNYPEITPCNNFGLTEIISSPNIGYFPEIKAPCAPFYKGIPEVIPSCYKPGSASIPNVLPFNPIRPCNVPEIVTPYFNNFPEVVIPTSCNTGCSGCEFCGAAQFVPNFCGVNPSFTPVEVEVVLPPTIPAQLNCNLGFLPSCGPVVNFNVEPLPFGPGFRY